MKRTIKEIMNYLEGTLRKGDVIIHKIKIEGITGLYTSYEAEVE